MRKAFLWVFLVTAIFYIALAVFILLEYLATPDISILSYFLPLRLSSQQDFQELTLLMGSFTTASTTNTI